MERAINEEFEYKGIILKTVKGATCLNCHFGSGIDCLDIEDVGGLCADMMRKDGISVKFIFVKEK